MAGDDDDISALLNEPNESDEISVGPLDDISTALSESIKSNEETAELTPEEAAWVDSCLEFDSELSDDKWTALRDALLDALSSYPTLDESPFDESPSAAMEIYVDKGSVQASEEADQNHVLEHHLSEKASEEGEQEDVTDHHLSEETRRKEVDNADDSVNEEDVESRENIFKVWDLETSVEEEEDELIQQLKKLLTGSRGQALQPNDSSSSLSQENIDELITSMEDLSLKPFDK